MKRLMMMLIMTGLFYMSQAQKRGPGPGDEKERMERVKTDLSLSDDQFQKWKAVHTKYGEELKAARDTRDQEKGKTIRDKFDKELEAILDESQKKKFAEMKGKRPRRKKGSK